MFDRYGNLAQTLNILQGSTFTDDRTQANRRSCDMTVADPTGALSPSNAQSLLATGATSGYTILVVAGGWQLGKLIVQVGDSKDTGATREVEITGQDESWLATRIALDSAWAVSAGTYWSWAFADLLTYWIPDADLSNFANITWPTPAIAFNPGDEPWTKMATEWAPAVGVELYQGSDAKYYLQMPPDPRTQEIDWYFTEGVNCTMTEVEHTFTDADVPNVYQRDGVGPGNSVVTFTALDDNPASSSYVGTFGYILDYTQDTLIASQAQAQADATCALYLGLGADEPVIVTCTPPAGWGVRSGQMIQVTRQAAGLDAAMVAVDTIVHAFFPGDTTTITGRRITGWAGVVG
jgi:hypothetical protein